MAEEPLSLSKLMKQNGRVHPEAAAKILGIRHGVLLAYMESGIAIYSEFKGVRCFRLAMLPLIRDRIMEARDGRPFDLGRKNMPGMRDYGK